MKKWLKVTIGISVSFVILLVGGGIVFYRMLTASLPEYNSIVKAYGISDNIEVYRDSMAVPYILAKTDEDAAFAMGYVHAQDRLFFMDLTRRAGEGRLSEILGTKVIPFDKMFRTVGIKKTAQEIFKQLSPESLKLLKAYSAGVNLYIHNAKGKYPIEFDALNYDPEPWTPVSSLVVIRMMAWELNISWWTDISFTHLIQKLGEEKVKEILPRYSENGPVIIPSELKNYPKISESFIETDKAFRKFMGMRGTHIGSNNWVVNGKMSASGKPLIANDTHLALSAPDKWYAAVIKSKNWEAAGVTLPGAPLIVLGKNNNISWTVTNIMEDDADFYIEKLDSTKTKYLFNGKWKNLRIIKDTIKVKDSLSVPLEIKYTHRGPIISDIHPYTFLCPDKDAPDYTMSMHWLGNDLSDELLTFYKINKAKNWNEFKSAFSTYATPGQNFVYADKDGNIGYIFGGKLPLRQSTSPTFVYDGTTDKYDWKGYVPESELPVMYNPPSNFIATANNKTMKNFKYHISNIWEPSSRIERITQLLTSKKIHTVNDYKKYQMDFISPYARNITRYILNAFSNVKITDKNLETSLELFKTWNYEFNEYSQVPAIYAMFFKYLLYNIYKNKLGQDLFNEFVFVANVPYKSVIQILEKQNSFWYDDVTTPQIENRDQIIRKSLIDALDELEKKYGKNLTNWQWGKLHKVVFKHAFSGFSSLLDGFINIGPFSIGGDGTTIFNTEYAFTEGLEKFPLFHHKEFENILGPAVRYIFDFAKPDEFYLILTTGESGNVMSKHYKDMTKMWLNGGYMKIKTDEKSITNKKNLHLTIEKQFN